MVQSQQINNQNLQIESYNLSFNKKIKVEIRSICFHPLLSVLQKRSRFSAAIENT